MDPEHEHHHLLLLLMHKHAHEFALIGTSFSHHKKSELISFVVSCWNELIVVARLASSFVFLPPQSTHCGLREHPRLSDSVFFFSETWDERFSDCINIIFHCSLQKRKKSFVCEAGMLVEVRPV